MSNYRFAHAKDASWNSYERHKHRYECIEQLLGQDTVGAEIGVYKGGFGEFLLPHTKTLYLVDPWYRYKPFWGPPSPDTSAVRAFINIVTIYADEMESGRVVVVPDFSEPFLQALPSGHLDWVYLDASHAYESTLRELRLALRAVKVGGYIIGDDYDADPRSKQHGVFEAVNQVLAETGAKLQISKSRQFAFRNPGTP